MLPRRCATAVARLVLLLPFLAPALLLSADAGQTSAALVRTVASGDTGAVRQTFARLAAEHPALAAAFAAQVIGAAEATFAETPTAALSTCLAALESARDLPDPAAVATLATTAAATAGRLAATDPVAALQLAAAIRELPAPTAGDGAAAPAAPPAPPASVRTPPTVFDTAVRSGSS